MIGARWVFALTVVAAAALAGAVICLLVGSELRVQVDRSYFSGDAGSMTMAEQEALTRQSILSTVLLELLSPLVTAALIVGVTAIALSTHRAGRLPAAEGI